VDLLSRGHGHENPCSGIEGAARVRGSERERTLPELL